MYQKLIDNAINVAKINDIEKQNLLDMIDILWEDK